MLEAKSVTLGKQNHILLIAGGGKRSSLLIQHKAYQRLIGRMGFLQVLGHLFKRRQAYRLQGRVLPIIG